MGGARGESFGPFSFQSVRRRPALKAQAPGTKKDNGLLAGKMRRVIAEALGVFAGTYVLMVGTMAVFQREMIYHPGSFAKSPAEVGLAEMTPVALKAADGWTVTHWYAPPSSQGAHTVVLFHGNAGTIADRSHKARAFLDAGHGVLLAEYRGFGGNPGKPSEEGLYEDARAVMRWLVTHGVPGNLIVLYGESLGTGVAVQMACEHRVKALLLEAPYTRLPDLAPPYLFPGLAEVLMVDRFETIDKVPALDIPLLVIHGERDITVPVSQGRAILTAATAHKEGVFLNEAGHNDIWDHAQEQVLDFLKRVTR